MTAKGCRKDRERTKEQRDFCSFAGNRAPYILWGWAGMKKEMPQNQQTGKKRLKSTGRGLRHAEVLPPTV